MPVALNSDDKKPTKWLRGSNKADLATAFVNYVQLLDDTLRRQIRLNCGVEWRRQEANKMASWGRHYRLGHITGELCAAVG